MSKQVNYNENLCAGAAIRDDKGRRISKLFEASHPKMTVGYAKNLIMPDTPAEQEFNFRQAGGGVIEDGVAVIDKVKGNSVVWNQLIKDFREPSNWLTNNCDATIVGDKIHIKFTSASSSSAFGVKSSAFSAGHKYCLLMNNENAMPLTAVKLGSAYSVDSYGSTLQIETPAITLAIPTSSESNGAFWFWPSDETKLEGDFSNIFAIDLTKMFGAGNEPATVEEFLSRKPKVADEYAYNEGEIINNKVEKVKATGVNLWNEEWEVGSINITTGVDTSEQDRIRMKGYLPVLPNTSYYCTLISDDSTKRGYFCYYDQNKKFIAYSGKPSQYDMNKVFTTPSNCYFVRFYLNMEYGKTYNHNICINLSDPAINGKYFPYEEHTLDLAWVKDIKDAEGVKLFEDGMRSAGTAFDEVGKNKAVKRLGSVDLGSLDWTKYTNADQELFQTKGLVGLILPSSSEKVANVTCNKYNALSVNDLYIHKGDGIGVNESGMIDIYDKALIGKTAEDFKTAMQGVLLYYELAEPIEVEYDEKNLTYSVVAGGTEEAIASEPSTAFRADIGYGIDAVKTILDLKARVEALEGK